ncbi:phage holin family protein [Plantibacter sp. YIM 135347]|uniref:phage holin family protein n=1 Tax=Plantibacter sp. YIM 135347 TaxID=3423919 RepID=UPI003D33370D
MTDHTTPSEQQAANTSLGDLLGEVSRDISTLMRQEVELAKAEVRQSAKRAGTGAGLLGGAGYSALMTLLFLSIALWWALGTLLGNGWSAVIVAAVWAIAAIVLFVAGKASMKQVQGIPQTIDTVKQIPDTLKKNEENR